MATGEFQYGPVRLIWCHQAQREHRCRWEVGARRVVTVSINWLKTGECGEEGGPSLCVYRAGPDNYYWPGANLTLCIGATDKVVMLFHFVCV
jgi:hypothetical protein